MRKLLAAGLMTLLALTIAVPPAGASQPLGSELQTVFGSVALPTRFTDVDNGYPGLGRRLWLANSNTNGSAMYVFAVDPETWGGAFSITDVADATGAGDMDVYFYSDFGNLEPLSGPGDAVTTAEYAKRAAGGETGFIPFGSKRALVFTINAVNATFKYSGFSMPELSLAKDNLSLTIPSGGYVSWRNDTSDYAFVKHSAASPEFNSSPGAGTGIRVGDTFVHQFLNPGTYNYTTSTGSGTITVTAGPGSGPPAS